jgi:hypothetical protein
MRTPETWYLAAKSPRTRTVSILEFFRQNNISMSSVLGSQYRAMTEAAAYSLALLTG